MKALILAGGLATRMRPVTDAVPKSLLPAMNLPFLEHQLDQLTAHGVTETILLTGHLADAFDPFVDAMARRGVRLRVSTEQGPLGTAGAVRSVLHEMDDTTIVYNGDAIVAGLDLSAAIAQHHADSALATLVLVHLDDAMGYGLVAHEGACAQGFVQFGVDGPAGRGGWINAGNYVIDARALADVPAGEAWSFETQVFPSLIASGAHVGAYESDGWWLDFGMPDRYLRAHADVLDGRARLRVNGRILQDASFDDGTSIHGPSLLGHAKAGAGAHIGPHAVIGDAVSIGAGARIERSVIHAGAVVGDGATVTDCIVGATARIDPGATVASTVVA